jgi:hypothetical protein
MPRLARRDGSLIVLEAEFDVEVKHLHLGHIPLGAPNHRILLAGSLVQRIRIP